MAIVLGAVSINTVKKDPDAYQGTGMALAGIIIGIICIILMIGLLILGVGISMTEGMNSY